ncbi:MAG: cysteine desulfurase [Bacteroidales bacterium]|nr:cysteine desulfurase [Bacteroidales bacterium]MBN2764637.1 cysteine desulfurase [Bacteroidales bacterium]
MSFDIKKVRDDFPILQQRVYGKPLIYFDNGATTQKPLPVIEIVNTLHRQSNSSIHRGIHYLGEQVTEAYENARKTIQKFIHAAQPHEIIFSAGTTASINGLAFSLGERFVREGDEIIITEMEHHSNIVPWQMLCGRKNARLKVVPFDDNGVLQLEKLETMMNRKTRLIAVMHASNTLATINPVKDIVSLAHRHDIPVLVDGAQSVPHIPVDVQDMDCDFFVFSGHKVYGPTGTGVLYGKEKWLDMIPPFQGGGEMVDSVTFEKTTYNQLPYKFEAGTTNYIGAIGMAKAIEYLLSTGLRSIAVHEQNLLHYAVNKLDELGYITIYGRAPLKTSLVTFSISHIHPYDAGMVLDKMGIAIRTGTHCAQPVMQHYGIEGNIRASFAMYNTLDEIDSMIEGIKKVKLMF